MITNLSFASVVTLLGCLAYATGTCSLLAVIKSYKYRGGEREVEECRGIISLTDVQDKLVCHLTKNMSLNIYLYLLKRLLFLGTEVFCSLGIIHNSVVGLQGGKQITQSKL